MYILLYFKWTMDSAGNSTQCYMAAWMGRESGGDWIHVSVWLRPFTAHLKLSQHCELTVFLLLFTESLSSVQLFATYGLLAHKASLSPTVSQRLPKFMSFESAMLSHHSTSQSSKSAPTTNAKEGEVEWFCVDLQDLLELIPKQRCLFHYRGLECKSRKSKRYLE